MSDRTGLDAVMFDINLNEVCADDETRAVTSNEGFERLRDSRENH